MITVYSDGTTISSDYVAAVSQPSIGYSMKLYANGSEVAGTIKRAQIELGAGSADGDYQAFSPVQVLSTQFSATIYNAPNLIGEEIEVRVGVLVGNAYKYVNIAYITITEQSTWQSESEVKGVGRMGLMYAPLGLSAGDYSPSDIATAIVTATGINVAVGGFTASQSVHIDDGWTCRDAIESMCARLGGYACEVDGGISILPYSATATYTLPTGFITARPDVKDSYTVNGLTVKADGDSYSYGTGGVTIDDPTATAATSAITWGNIQGYSFNPGTLKVALIDPRVTPADTISYNGWNVPSRGISITYDGGYFGTYAAVGITAEEEEALVEGPLSSKVATAYDIATEAREVAEATGQYFWHDTNGAHVSTDALNPTGASNSLWNSLGLLIRKVANNLVSITQSAIAFFDGNGNNASNITASFGPSGFQIGQDDGSHLLGDYHSLQLIDKGGNAYFHVSDLRGTDGTATITDTFTGDGTTTRFVMTNYADSTDYTVKVNGTAVTSGINKGGNYVQFTTAPASGDSIEVTYVTSSSTAKAFTFGSRGTGNIGARSVVMGTGTAQGGYACSFGSSYASGSYSHAEGYHANASGLWTHAEGYITTASGNYSHAEGNGTTASDSGSHAEGYQTTASGGNSHAEGFKTTASGSGSHAEGYQTTGGNSFSHAGGEESTASGARAHAEGGRTTASGNSSHAEGYQTTASGIYSHAEGALTVASGYASHAEGSETLASSNYQHVVGRYNVEDATGTYLEIVGNGSVEQRSNARTLDTSGNEILAGGLTATGRITGAGITSTGAHIDVQSTNFTDAVTPSESYNGNGIISLRDKNGKEIGYVRPESFKDGYQGIAVAAKRTDGGTIHETLLRIAVNSAGSTWVGFTGDGKTAWRKALNVVEASDQSRQNAKFITYSGADQIYGLYAACINANNTDFNGKNVGVIFRNGGISLYNGTDNNFPWQISGLSGTIDFSNAFTSTVAKVITAASGFTISQASYVQNGKMGQWYMTVKTTNAMSANTQYTIGTIVSGKRPATWSPVTFGETSNAYGNGRMVAGGSVIVRPSASIAAGSTSICSAQPTSSRKEKHMELTPYILGWLVPTLLGAALGYLMGKVKRLTARDKAIEEGMRVLLRAEISRKYERYVVDGKPMTTEVRRELEEEWHAYHDGLGGNGTGEAMYRELCELKLEVAHV